MLTPTRALIAALAVTVVGLGTALGVVLATDDEDDQGTAGARGFAGMMMAMGGMDSNVMLVHMREVLGEDGFQRMQQHFADHRSGAPVTGMSDIDEMMHLMMDGMMREMPPDANNIMPGPGHSDMTTPTGTPTRAP